MADPELLNFLNRLADVASDSIMPLFRARTAVHSKGVAGFDPVTEADRAAEAAMRELISTNYPDHGIVGEEYGSDRPDADYVWVLDPIDGTRAFISGLPVWGTLIGLQHQGRPVLGMMAQAFTGERYAGDCESALYDGPGGHAKLQSRACPSLAEATLFTTTPALFDDGERRAYDRIEDQVQLARYGCDCYAYCMVAAGHADMVIEAGLKPYDIVALIPIIEGAGGRVTNWEGNSAAAGGRIAASGNAALHDLMLAGLNSA